MNRWKKFSFRLTFTATAQSVVAPMDSLTTASCVWGDAAFFASGTEQRRGIACACLLRMSNFEKNPSLINTMLWGKKKKNLPPKKKIKDALKGKKKERGRERETFSRVC